MKNTLYCLALFALLTSCSDDDANQSSIAPELIGQWQLVARYLDPGDGSGDFESVDSEKTIEIYGNSTFTMNGPLCGLSTAIGENVSGTLDPATSTLHSNENCEVAVGSEYIYHIQDSDLIISWTACIEGCSNKYQKVESGG